MTEKLKISREAIEELAKILKESDLTEIEYETEQGRIRVVRNIKEEAPSVILTSPSVQNSQSASINESLAPIDALSHPGTIKSPMVGMVYLAPEPNAAFFVKEGDRVSSGQTLLIIESMKVMNPIKATKAGTVTKIFVNDATPVEFNEPLMIIE